MHSIPVCLSPCGSGDQGSEAARVPHAVNHARLTCVTGMVRTGALMLGLLHLDGEAEAVKADAGEAVRWLRIAAQYGSREAPGILGTLFNTGQYG